MADEDALVGLRFELSGGLGKMAGDIVGKAGGLYLIRRDGAAHLELIELDDLRGAKFYVPEPAEVAQTSGDPSNPSDAGEATEHAERATAEPARESTVRPSLAERVRRAVSARQAGGEQ